MTIVRVAGALADARARGVASLDAQVLLARVLETTRTRLIAHDDEALTEAQLSRWRGVLARRASGEPLAYVLGEKEFHGLLLEVTPDVLVPRPETELLVDWAIELLAKSRTASPTVLDLGTGSGAVALAIKRAHPGAAVSASDRSEWALTVARRNNARLGLDVAFEHGSWWHGFAGRQFDVVVANPPYIAAGDAHLAALRHEPACALVAGDTAMAALVEIIAGASEHVRPRGWLLLEHGFDQAAAVRSLLQGVGFVAAQTRRDLAGQERTTGAMKPA